MGEAGDCGCDDPATAPAVREVKRLPVDTCDTARFAANPGLYEASRARAALPRASIRSALTVPRVGTDERSALESALESAAEAIIGHEIPTDQVYLLAVATKLNLGSDASGPLTAEVPFRYTSPTSSKDMISTFLADWAGYLHPESANWASLMIDRGTRAQLPSGTLTGPIDWLEDVFTSIASPGDDAVPGLFWTEDYLNGALVMAVQTAYAFAPLLGLMAPEAAEAGGYRGSELVREKIAGTLSAATGTSSGRILIHDGWETGLKMGGITIKDDGTFVLSMPGKKLAFAFLGGITLFQPMRDMAAVADYMFWWARRLHGMALETGESNYKDIGILAARCGLAQVVKIAAVIVHEIGHHAGPFSAWHCNESYEQACNQYIAEYTFQHAVMALLGLPDPLSYSGSWAFAPDFTERGYFVPIVTCGTTEFTATHDGTSSGHASTSALIYTHPHDLEMSVTISNECGGTGIPFDIRVTPSDLEAWMTKGLV
jgi:hypothetical protein